MADALALGAMKDVISCDKLQVQITFDPEISEWDNPIS